MKTFWFNGEKFEILIEEEELKKIIQELARKVFDYYKKLKYKKLKAKRIIAIIIYKGATYFGTSLLTELSKLILNSKLNIDIIDDGMVVRAYGSDNKPLSNLEILYDLKHDIRGEFVLVIEDFVDRTLTFQSLRTNLRNRHPLDLCSVIMLGNEENCQGLLRDEKVTIGRVFEKKGRWIVGAGLDNKDKNRGWPFVACKVE